MIKNTDPKNSSSSSKKPGRIFIPIIIILFACLAFVALYFILRVVIIPQEWSISNLLSEREKISEVINTEQVPIIGEDAGLPGLSQDELRNQLIKEQFQCTDPETGESGLYRSVCFKETQDCLKEVYIFSRALSTIDFIDANIAQKGIPSDELAIEYLSYVATFPKNTDHHDAAMSWVKETLPTITEIRDLREKSFGGIQYRLYGISEARSLELGVLP